jgi:hypothetical protein
MLSAAQRRPWPGPGRSGGQPSRIKPFSGDSFSGWIRSLVLIPPWIRILSPGATAVAPSSGSAGNRDPGSGGYGEPVAMMSLTAAARPGEGAARKR